MPDLHIFKAQVGIADPVALQYQNVAIHYVQNIWYKRVDFLEAIPEFQCANLGAVLAGNQSGRTNIANLEMADNEFGIWRWYPIDDVQMLLFHPAGISKYQLRNVQVPVDAAILINDPNLVSTEIAVWEDNRPSMIAVNGNVFPVLASRIRAIGYRFHTIDPEPITPQEKQVVQQIRAESPNTKLKDGDLLVQALKEGRLPVTRIWCSGRAMGD
jgi:hypothetical protein